MKTNNEKISIVEQFIINTQKSLAQYYHQRMSANAKRGWQTRRNKLSTSKVAV
jgi:hypothetical protein